MFQSTTVNAPSFSYCFALCKKCFNPRSQHFRHYVPEQFFFRNIFTFLAHRKLRSLTVYLSFSVSLGIVCTTMCWSSMTTEARASLCRLSRFVRLEFHMVSILLICLAPCYSATYEDAKFQRCCSRGFSAQVDAVCYEKVAGEVYGCILIFAVNRSLLASWDIFKLTTVVFRTTWIVLSKSSVESCSMIGILNVITFTKRTLLLDFTELGITIRNDWEIPERESSRIFVI